MELPDKVAALLAECPSEDPSEALRWLRSLPTESALALYEGFDSNSTAIAKATGIKDRRVREFYSHIVANPDRRVGNFWQKRAEVLQRELEKARNWREIVSDAILSTCSTFEPVPPPKLSRKSPRDEHMAVQLIGDVHVGEQTFPHETGGVAQYGFDIFLKRLDTFQQHFTILMEDIRATYPVPCLMCNFLGDIATSEGVFPTQAYRNDLELNEQIVQSGFHMANIVRYFAGMFPRVYVNCVSGNHKPKGITFDSDAMIYYVMELLLRDQPNVDFARSKAPFLVQCVSREEPFVDFGSVERKWWWLITHGHQAKRYLSIPYYGLDRVKMRYGTMTGQHYDLMMVGHSHEDAVTNNWIVNGCWPGGNEFSVDRMQAAGRPSQHLAMFHPKYGMTWQAQVYLDDEPTLTGETAHGVWTPIDESVER